MSGGTTDPRVPAGTNAEPDPIVARRRQVAAVVRATKRFGYLLLLASIVGFVAGVWTDFESWAVGVAVVGLVGACIVLPIPIVLGYAVSKAEREDPLT